jgi:hypothetical protein
MGPRVIRAYREAYPFVSLTLEENRSNDHREGDRYAGEWPREQFRRAGITYEVAIAWLCLSFRGNGTDFFGRAVLIPLSRRSQTCRQSR